jgi:peroxiredoxin
MQGASFVMNAWAARNAVRFVRDSAACFGRRLLVNFAFDAIDKAKFPKRRAAHA